MLRKTTAERADWRSRVESLGLIWHTSEGKPYWNEGAYYAFRPDQIEQIRLATTELYALFLQAGERIIADDLFHLFGIPEWVRPAIRKAWEQEPPALNYGRFDLGYDGVNPPKLFEFNADTPTSLLESSVIQEDWRDAVFPGAGQFNDIDGALVEQWRSIAPRLQGEVVHFLHAASPSGEDEVTVAYLRDTARRAGIPSIQLPIDQVGWDGLSFVDLDLRPMQAIYKLYPWEWMVREAFGQNILHSGAQWIEPIWKMIWSNKAILPVLWRVAPDHPNLLRAEFEAPTGTDIAYVRKPILSREGANITLYRGGNVIAQTDGAYGGEAWVYQELYDLPAFDGVHPVIGSWLVDGYAAGIGIREGSLITHDTARFVPHVILD